VSTVDFTAQASLRKAALEAMGAPEGAEMFGWPTASAALDRSQGALYIATELEPSPEDWESVCLLLKLVQFDNGTDGPFRADIGEPVEIMGLATWSLSIPVPVS
jgi:hypothetical protein